MKMIPQSAVIPVLEDGRICVITSSDGMRWGLPKGHIDPGYNAPQSALKEAWEEAGLKGQAAADPVGEYTYSKYGRTYRVAVYVMTVSEILDRWPEMGEREREWVTAEEAIHRVKQVGQREILRKWLETRVA